MTTTEPVRGVVRTALSVLAVITLAACSSIAGGSPASTLTLEGTLWRLTEYAAAEGKVVPVPKAISASASFAAGEIAGNAGCNDYRASYTVDGNDLSIGPAAVTMKACGRAATALETAYLAVLGRVASYSIAGNVLLLRTGEGKVGLRFAATAAHSLTGVRWVATSVNNGTGGVVSVVPATTLSATFGAQGTVAGSGGCNDYSGPYATDGTGITIGPLAATKKLCGTPAGVDDQEAEFLAALQKATTYAISGNKLELRDGGRALQVVMLSTLGSE